MKLSRLDQVLVALWLTLAVVCGVIIKSWSLSAGILALGVFCTAPALLKPWLNSSSLPVRTAGQGVFALWLLALAVVLISGAERLYWVNARSYPLWLSSGELPTGTDTGRLRNEQCKDLGPIEIVQKVDGLYFLRCGDMWLSSKIYYSAANPMATSEFTN